ncbi:PREDICTED: sperm acrosome-associated protein 5 isoform X5 [Hipposideros armiger]|uniref:Sperm acrosome-associated protein 5 isoform X5 n=1 Tax=Hipposideros armiger TaxID=186990 RepID=A0A8B7QIY0_HIPAR|nr:PREDICTED: sperm acrosome-associated protein 5 isoform X5 [Hipposideros armiger]
MLALKYLRPGEESSSIPLKPLVFVVVLYLSFSLMCVCNKDGTEEYAEVPSPPASMFRNLSLRSLLIEPRVPEYPVHGLCVAHYESGFDTSFVDHNPDGSSEYGIFQLNSAWWCDNGITPTLNLCHMECRDLLNRHILDDIMCVKQVVSSRNGMNAWDSWTRHCYGHDLSEWLKGCNMHAKPDAKIMTS